MNRPIPVLIVIDHLHIGGAQEFVWQMCRQIPDDQIKITVCALRSGGVYVSKLKSINVDVIEIAPSKEKRWWPLIVFKMSKLISKQRHLAIHTFLENSFALCTPLAYLQKITTLHTIVAIRKQTPFWYFPLMSIYQHMIFVYLSFHPQELVRSGIQRNKIRSVEVAVNIDEFLEIERDPSQKLPNISTKPSDLLITSIARLHPDKGHEYLIRAWPRVVESLPNARLLIVGEGEDQQRLQTMIEQLRLTHSIYLPGYRSDIKEILQRTDIFVRPSVNEGVNLITIQAMAAGLPVIGFQTDVPKEIIVANHNGVLVPLRDSDALANAIINLGSRPDLRARYGSNARQGVREYYSANDIFDYYLKMYRLIGDNRHLDEITDMINRPWPFISSMRAAGDDHVA